MSANEAGDYESVVTDRTIRFWATLIVATLIVGFTAYVLSFALLAPSGGALLHRAASPVFIVAS